MTVVVAMVILALVFHAGCCDGVGDGVDVAFGRVGGGGALVSGSTSSAGIHAAIEKKVGQAGSRAC